MAANEFRDGRLILVSGLDGKSPACFLIESGGRRILLDLGVGANGEPVEGIDRIGRVDALLISHCHTDHVGGLIHLDRIGNPPVFATEETWSIVDRLHPGAPKQVPPASLRKLLPLQGSLEIAGIDVKTGRDGHAPGGVWLWLGLADGFLYTGDYSTESVVYPFDETPKAALALVDASYGGHAEAIEPQVARLAEKIAGGAVLPVPVGGRGPEIALRLEELGLPRAWLDPNVFEQMERLASAMDRSAETTAHAAAARFLAEPMAPEPKPTDIVICTNGAADDGLSAELLARWRGTVPFIFTGHVPKDTPAFDAVSRGDATIQRINVHPRLSDNARLARVIGARRVVPGFSTDEGRAALAEALRGDPIAVVTDREIPLAG